MRATLVSIGMLLALLGDAGGQTPTASAALPKLTPPPNDCTVYPAQSSSPYILPWQIGQSFEVWRSTEHWSPGNRGVGLYAFDFRMPIDTKITAAREGKVVAVQESYLDGNGEDLKENLVFVKHSDGTVARYFHLTHDGVLVDIGDEVEQGQVIAQSGNTGDSGGPHLHFRCAILRTEPEFELQQISLRPDVAGNV